MKPDLAKENAALRKALRRLTIAQGKIVDLFIKSSMENLGIKPKRRRK